MKHVVTLEAQAEPDSGVLLLSVSMALCDHRLNPESLVWSYFREKQEARVWLTLDTAPHLAAFIECCRSLPGVQYVSALPAEERSKILDRIHGLESRSPFESPPVPFPSAEGGA